MSDLTDHGSDQEAGPRARIRPANRLVRDRRLRLSDLAVTLFLLVVGCVRVPEPEKPPPELPRPELWVDAFSRAGGDGTSARPLKAVPRPVPNGTIVHLRTGLYPGPFVLGEGARLEGQGEVVLTGEAGQTVVTAEGASLEGISLQGGAIGLEAGAKVTLKRVHFSGQRRQAAVVHGQLTMVASRLEASVEGIDGVVVERGALFQANDTKFTGGFRRAVMTVGGTLELTSVSAEGPRTLVHAMDATSRLKDLHSSLGSGPALFFAGGSVTLSGAELIGHEFSVQLFRGVDATISGLTARGGLAACLAAIGSKLSLDSSTFSNCGSNGALSLLDSSTVLAKVKITGSRELALFVRKGTLRVSGGLEVSGVAIGNDDVLGDAIHVRDATMTAEGELVLSELEGSGIYASAFAQLSLARVSVERARKSALFVERGAKVKIGALLVRGGGGSAVVVPDKASVEVESLSVSGGSEMPVYAECRAGAVVALRRLESTVQQLPSHCVAMPPAK